MRQVFFFGAKYLINVWIPAFGDACVGLQYMEIFISVEKGIHRCFVWSIFLFTVALAKRKPVRGELVEP